MNKLYIPRYTNIDGKQTFLSLEELSSQNSAHINKHKINHEGKTYVLLAANKIKQDQDQDTSLYYLLDEKGIIHTSEQDLVSANKDQKAQNVQYISSAEDESHKILYCTDNYIVFSSNNEIYRFDTKNNILFKNQINTQLSAEKDKDQDKKDRKDKKKDKKASRITKVQAMNNWQIIDSAAINNNLDFDLEIIFNEELQELLKELLSILDVNKIFGGIYAGIIRKLQQIFLEDVPSKFSVNSLHTFIAAMQIIQNFTEQEINEHAVKSGKKISSELKNEVGTIIDVLNRVAKILNERVEHVSALQMQKNISLLQDLSTELLSAKHSDNTEFNLWLQVLKYQYNACKNNKEQINSLKDRFVENILKIDSAIFDLNKLNDEQKQDFVEFVAKLFANVENGEQELVELTYKIACEKCDFALANLLAQKVNKEKFIAQYILNSNGDTELELKKEFKDFFNHKQSTIFAFATLNEDEFNVIVERIRAQAKYFQIELDELEQETAKYSEENKDFYMHEDCISMVSQNITEINALYKKITIEKDFSNVCLTAMENEYLHYVFQQNENSQMLLFDMSLKQREALFKKIETELQNKEYGNEFIQSFLAKNPDLGDPKILQDNELTFLRDLKKKFKKAKQNNINVKYLLFSQEEKQNLLNFINKHSISITKINIENIENSPFFNTLKDKLLSADSVPHKSNHNLDWLCTILQEHKLLTAEIENTEQLADELKYIYDRNAYLHNKASSFGLTPLMLACQSGNLEEFDKYLKLEIQSFGNNDLKELIHLQIAMGIAIEYENYDMAIAIFKAYVNLSAVENLEVKCEKYRKKLVEKECGIEIYNTKINFIKFNMSQNLLLLLNNAYEKNNLSFVFQIFHLINDSCFDSCFQQYTDNLLKKDSINADRKQNIKLIYTYKKIYSCIDNYEKHLQNDRRGVNLPFSFCRGNQSKERKLKAIKALKADLAQDFTQLKRRLDKGKQRLDKGENLTFDSISELLNKYVKQLKQQNIHRHSTIGIMSWRTTGNKLLRDLTPPNGSNNRAKSKKR